MKVCTDACLFGAWVADHTGAGTGYGNVLDIGTGTGLLSLMLAQANENIKTDAVELDGAAASQAAQNFSSSAFADRLTVYNNDILQFNPGKTYDIIISNPPFYEKDLRSYHAGKNAAKHDTQLTLALLLQKIEELLAPAGMAALLLSYHRMDDAEMLFQKHGFHIHKKLLVHQSVKHPFPFRVCWMVAKSSQAFQTETIIIKGPDLHYSAEFVRLLKPYYLKL